jgi:hypothetical protein
VEDRLARQSGTDQGDQIGRIFAQWVIVSLGQCIWKLKKWLNFLSTLPTYALHVKRHVLINILTKNGLRYILGDFFTNSSGHPGTDVMIFQNIFAQKNWGVFQKKKKTIFLYIQNTTYLLYCENWQRWYCNSWS